VVEDSDFYPFGGERVVLDGVNNNYKFTGQERDSESGLDYFIARHYAFTLGRFLQPDRLLSSGTVSSPQTWNRYTYALNNPLKFTDPFGLYVFAAGTTDKQKDAFKKGLTDLEKARDSYKKDSAEYKRLDAIINAYGKEGKDNGVTVAFGATTSGRPAETDVGVKVDAQGNKVTTANNPTGQDIRVTIDSSQYNTDIGLLPAVAHEGSHVADGSAVVGALPTNLLSPAVASILNGPLNLTLYQVETNAFNAEVVAIRALASQYGIGTYSVDGVGIWSSSWSKADAATLSSAGISQILANPNGAYKVTQDQPGRKIIE
jgi:RHS repeat-associated protein